MDNISALRRDRLIKDIARRFMIRAMPGREDRFEIVFAASDYEKFTRAVMRGQEHDALSRGYYLGLGGECELRTAPDWACDRSVVAHARRTARIRRTLRRITR